MKIIGITGGIGAGKSSILAYLEKNYGAVVCQADQVGRRLQEKGTQCYKEIISYFGKEILADNGTLDREKLADIVFSDAGKLDALNLIMHPAVKEQIKKQIAMEAEKGTSLFVLEAALLIEDHYDQICDEIWYVYARDEVRKKRLFASRGYSRKKLEEVFAVQLSKEEFLLKCDRAVDNSDTFEETCGQLQEFLGEPKKYKNQENVK